MQKQMNIAIALNQKVLVQACVLLKSLAMNNIHYPICVYVHHSELTQEDLAMLQSSVETDHNHNRIISAKIDKNKFDGLPYNHFWSLEMYYRLLLPELWGDEIDRILYLDIDMIVNKDISEFYFMELGTYDFAAAKDMEYETIIAHDNDENRKRNELFRSLEADGMNYFCSGMLLMNLKQMKERYTFHYYMDIFDKIREQVILPDQDLLNYVHYKNVLLVDEWTYNLFTQTAHQSGMTYEQAKENVAILHFTGQAKPWTINLIRYDIEKIWWEYARRLPFYYDILEQVFFMSMESSLVEKQFDLLAEENEQLRQIIFKFNELVKKL